VEAGGAGGGRNPWPLISGCTGVGDIPAPIGLVLRGPIGCVAPSSRSDGKDCEGEEGSLFMNMSSDGPLLGSREEMLPGARSLEDVENGGYSGVFTCGGESNVWLMFLNIAALLSLDTPRAFSRLHVSDSV